MAYNREKARMYQEDNKERLKAKRRMRWERDKDKILAKKHGLTVSQLVALLLKHDHACAICCKKQVDLNHRLRIDRCQATGEVRGVLCVSCNTSIGVFGGTVESIDKVISYLTEDC